MRPDSCFSLGKNLRSVIHSESCLRDRMQGIIQPWKGVEITEFQVA